MSKSIENEKLVLILNELFPKQAGEIMRAVEAKIPIMLINNANDATEKILHKALKNAGAIIAPPCIMEYKKENVSFLSIYLNVNDVPCQNQENTGMRNPYENRGQTEKSVNIDDVKKVFEEVVGALLEKIKNAHPSDVHNVAAELRIWCSMYYGKLGDE